MNDRKILERLTAENERLRAELQRKPASPPKLKITRVHAACWEAIYSDGKKVYEDDELNLGRVLETIGVDYKAIEIDADEDNPEASFPEDLADLRPKRRRNGGKP